MPAQLRRLAPPQQLQTGVALELFTVPADTQYILKSVYLTNARSDKASLTYQLTIVPAVGPEPFPSWGVAQKVSLMAQQTIAPFEVHTKEFAVLVFEPGDKLVAYTTSGSGGSGLWVHAHGLVVTP
ncbi:hypothetical protein SEA_GUDMIT_28 [Gordonia phage Gudmit]|nr:hypothetical protein SEA_GUDMIT_28 [Gordonia phage Gudmit]